MSIWSKSRRNVSSTLSNLCHKELRQLWKQKRYNPVLASGRCVYILQILMDRLYIWYDVMPHTSVPHLIAPSALFHRLTEPLKHTFPKREFSERKRLCWTQCLIRLNREWCPSHFIHQTWRDATEVNCGYRIVCQFTTAVFCFSFLLAHTCFSWLFSFPFMKETSLEMFIVLS